jgi:hypothetical protein
MFVKGKRDSRNVDMPEAIAQAIAFAEVTRSVKVHINKTRP